MWAINDSEVPPAEQGKLHITTIPCSKREGLMIFVAAFAPELDALQHEESAVLGVGLVEAALGAGRVIAERKPDHVVLIGTVGAYPRAKLAIGEVVVAERVILASPSGALVSAMPASESAIVEEGFAGARVVVATTLAITTDDAVAAALEDETGAHVEHLEAFAVARACALAGVRFSAVFGVANIVGARGRDEWRAHHERAAAAACASVLKNPRAERSPA
jgi:nucleoside phosphorylase